MSGAALALVLIEASARSKIADYIDALAYIYGLVILAYIVSTWMFSFGVRIPYNRFVSGLLGFLRDVSEPYLRIFRRFIPSLGSLDLSPILALVVLYAVARIISNLVRG